jgi:hypothetical protein
VSIATLLADKNEGNDVWVEGEAPTGEIPQDITSEFTVSSDGIAHGEIGDGALDGTEQDWFRVDLLAGHEYVIRIDGSTSNPSDGNTLLPPEINGIYDATGSFLGHYANTFTGSPNYAAETSFTPDTSGVYFVSATSYSSYYQGTYTLRISDQTSPGSDVSAPPLELDAQPQPYSFTITRSGDLDQESTVEWQHRLTGSAWG